jgi:hypothetical protein
MSCGSWRDLPTEIVLEILSDLSIEEVLSFNSSCRSFYHRYGNPSFLSHLLRAWLRQPLSDVYWFLPVATVKGEVDKFREVCEESRPSNAKVTDLESEGASMAFKTDFPLLEFFRANHSTDSMRNRRRLWRISQQFREIWHDYRTSGYTN